MQQFSLQIAVLMNTLRYAHTTSLHRVEMISNCFGFIDELCSRFSYVADAVPKPWGCVVHYLQTWDSFGPSKRKTPSCLGVVTW